MNDSKKNLEEALNRYSKLNRTLDQAKEFLYAYKVLSEHKLSRYKKGEYLPMFSADTVQLIFAIELFFKALLSKYGKDVKGHNLLKLFKKLPAEVQDEIKMSLSEHMLKTQKRSFNSFESSFEDMLKNYSTTFQDFRYFHELNHIVFNSEFCDGLVQVLNRLVSDYKREMMFSLNLF